MRRIGAVAAATGLAVVSIVGTAGAARADTPPYGTSSNDTPVACATGTVGCPTGDPFYAAPANLAQLADGAIVGSRPTTIAQPGPMAKAAYTITYRSEDTFGAPVLGSATVLTPTVAYAGAGTQPLVAFQFAEDSLGRQCAPSYSLAHSGSNDIIAAESADVVSLLTMGYVVVIPDAEGPAEQFIAGRQEGHAVLDGVRAAEAFAPAGLTPATRVAMMGYSGGANSTGWAAELAGSYAPALNIVGTIEGGTPADLTATAKYNDGTVTFGLVLLAAVGVDRAYPAAGIYNDLNPAGKAAYAAIGTQCIQGLGTYAFGTLDSYTTTPGLIDTPTFQATLANAKLGQSAPSFPIFNYHATTDEIVPYAQDKTLVDYYCAHGVAVDHVTFPADHFTGEIIGVPIALTWLAGRFNGAPVTNTCAITNLTAAGPGAALPEAPLAALLPLVGLGLAGTVALRRRRRTSAPA